MKQDTMFTTQDLPIFSGTAYSTSRKSNAPANQTGQTSFAKCKLCLDTGSVTIKFRTRTCWCQAGQELKKEKAQQ